MKIWLLLKISFLWTHYPIFSTQTISKARYGYKHRKTHHLLAPVLSPGESTKQQVVFPYEKTTCCLCLLYQRYVELPRFRFLPHLRLYQIINPVTGNEAPTKEAKEAKILVGSPPIVPTCISKLAR